MKCFTIDQLTRVAAAGARKMNDEGYRFRLFPMSKVAGNVIKSNGTTYRVNTISNTCSCPFFAANKHFGRTACTCKHLVWLRDELAYDADIARRAEEMEADAPTEYELADTTDFDMQNAAPVTAPSWPVCVWHGPHDALIFNDDVPEAACTHCERRRF